MVVHEERRRSNNTVGEFRYERVGMFRSDVLYVNDIDIMDGDATTTLVNNNPRYMSDSLFYGIRWMVTLRQHSSTTNHGTCLTACFMVFESTAKDGLVVDSST